jgi:Arc/MetJ-type ribon-helix-helix transcriptional regulator
MDSLSVPLSDDLRAWSKGQVGGDAYPSEADYVRALIERDREDALARLSAALDEGRLSGPSGRTIRQIIAAERARLG